MAFTVAAYALSLSPGPSNLYILACTIGSGSRGGLAAASGMALGSVIYAILTAAGISALIVVSPTLFTGIKLGGACYLLYLGVTTLYKAHKPQLRGTVVKAKHVIFRQSLIVELTNPKTILFFLAFLPQFVELEAASIPLQLLILGLIYALIALSSDLFVVSLYSKIKRLIEHRPEFAIWQERVAGAILILLGLIILSEIISHSFPY